MMSKRIYVGVKDIDYIVEKIDSLCSKQVASRPRTCLRLATLLFSKGKTLSRKRDLNGLGYS